MDLCHICDSSTRALEQHLWEPGTGRQYAKLILMKMVRYSKDFEEAVVSRAEPLVMKLQKGKSDSERALMNSICG